MFTGHLHLNKESTQLGKPNYSFQKRQKELAKQAKKEEKRLRKLTKVKEDGEESVTPSDSVEPPAEG